MVMFDMDGTIGDTLPMCDEAFKRAVEPYLQRAMTEEEMKFVVDVINRWK